MDWMLAHPEHVWALAATLVVLGVWLIWWGRRG
jgi:hypothetical protein